MTNEELERAVERVDGFVQRWEARIGFGAQTGDLIYAVTAHGFSGDAELRASDLRALLSERAELLAAVERMRDCLLGIALSDRYRRYPKQHEDGGVRGQSGLRAIRALTGQHGSHLNDEDVVRLDKAARAALITGEEK